jgi:penicillin-binding protein 1A
MAEVMDIQNHILKFTNPIAGKTWNNANQSDRRGEGSKSGNVCVCRYDRSARFQSITYGQGATAALPVWATFMKLCYADENFVERRA